ncbi:hypothetical protein SAMN05216474_0875 [Lishizhenia tianjinensis]|uniref:Uncharacterized protein n=1 Tax=Lishizhenia tianjinensis TaxID=477690 RepID=A0A1I6YGG0_9FLAO|nr:hypothetical protein [Lishizhenia tianjinensis]SFT49421.1 hypothetical protein SAMN05216474_0875 [Lishizhenia tianjinensis]
MITTQTLVKRLLSILLPIFFFTAQVYSQKWYLKPSFSYKYNTLEANQDMSFELIKDYAPINVYQPGSFWGLSSQLGIALGVTLKDNKTNIEFGVYQDAAGRAFGYEHFAMIENASGMYFTSVGPTKAKGNLTLITNRLGVAVERQLKKYKYVSIATGISTGVFFNYSDVKYAPFFVDYSGSSYGQLNPDIELLNYENLPSRFYGIRPYVQLNAGLEFFNKKGKLICGINFKYTQGFGDLAHFTDRFTLRKDNQIYHVDYSSYSKGSGFYVELNRKFQLFPWVKFRSKAN